VLPGIAKAEANLKDQLFYIEGTAAPSSIVSAIESTGRDAILRGSGTSNSASVCILETHASGVSDPVRGLARMVQVSDTRTLVDLTLRGVSPGTYHATIRETGDISRGAASTGGIWHAVKQLVAPAVSLAECLAWWKWARMGEAARSWIAQCLCGRLSVAAWWCRNSSPLNRIFDNAYCGAARRIF